MTRWPYTVPSIAHVLRHGLDLDPAITVFIGPNGAGKSTLVEAVAAVWARRITAFRSDWLQQSLGRPAAEDSPLHQALRLDYTPGGPVGGLFLRAERLHAQAGGFGIGRWSDRIANPILERSHGEGFLQVLAGMVAEPGLYVLDEPESALSFDSSLMLLTLMCDMRAAGSQGAAGHSFADPGSGARRHHPAVGRHRDRPGRLRRHRPRPVLAQLPQPAGRLPAPPQLAATEHSPWWP